MVHSFYRIIKFATQDFWRNIWLSLITISILILALVSINSLVVFRLISSEAINAVKDKVDVSVYFNTDVSVGRVNEVKSELNSREEVKEVTYISPEEALAKFKERHKNDPEILASLKEVEGNPMGSSLVIKAHNLSDYREILNALEVDEFKNLIQDKSFDDHKIVIARINSIAERVEKIALGVIAIFILISIIIVFNTIRVIIYAHQKEIEIKRLVGAANWFIKAPYFLEGFFYSFLSVAATAGIVYITLSATDPYINDFFINSDFSVLSYFKDNFINIFGIQFLAILFLNIVGSSLAVGKYLKI